MVSFPLKIKNKKGGGGGVTSHPIHTGGAKVALTLQISRLNLKVYLQNTPYLEFHQTSCRLLLSDSC